MLQIQLWRGDDLVSTRTADDTKEADKVIDQHINDVHDGKHGQGSFLLNAYHTGRLGVFIGQHWRSEGLRYTTTEG